MFLLSTVGVPLTFWTVAITDILLTVMLFIIRKPRLSFQFSPSAYALIFVIVIGLKFLFIFWSALIKPVIDPDLLVCYTLAAKMIFVNGAYPIGWPIGDETLFCPLSQAWPAIAFGHWDDTILTVANPLLYLGLCTIFYCALARSFKQWFAPLGALLLGTIPFLVIHAGTAYADFPQMLYYSVATIYIYLFMKYLKKEDLLLGCLALGLSVWVKRSGIYYAGIDLAVLAAFLAVNRKKISLVAPALLFLGVALPWIFHQPFQTMQDYAVQAVTAPKAFPLAVAGAQIWQAVLRNTFLEDNWHLLGILFIAALVFYCKKAFSGPRLYLLAMIFLQCLALFIIFAFTDRAVFILNETLLNRLTLPFIPIVLLYCLEVFGAGEERI